MSHADGADLATISRQLRQLVLDVASLRDHVAALTVLPEHSSERQDRILDELRAMRAESERRRPNECPAQL